MWDEPGKIPELKKKVQYTCPMHPEIIQDGPGNCPICGMDLVPMEPTEEEDATYKDLLKKNLDFRRLYCSCIYIGYGRNDSR